MIIDGKEVLSLAHVADRIDKSESYVKAEIEARQFQLVIVEKRGKAGNWRAFYYSDEAVWPHEAGQAAYNKFGTMDFHYLLNRDSVFPLLEDAIRVFIPLDSLRCYQKEATHVDLSKIISSKKYTPAQVARFIGRSRKRVYELIEEGTLKATKRGGGPRAPLEIVGSVVLAYLEGRPMDP